jgi:hypothetical protein
MRSPIAKRPFVTSAFIFFALAGAACAQLRGPLLGYVPDGGSIRAMYGIPAAGAVGSVLDAGRQLTLVAVSPTQTFALATANTGVLLLLTPNANGSAVSVAPVAGAAAGSDRIVFSPNGGIAALWYQGHIQIISGLPSNPVTRVVDASFLTGAPSALAVSDDGQWTAGAWPEGVYAFGPQNQVITLPVEGLPEALCFFHSKADVAVITATQVVTIADIGGAATPTVLWSKPPDPPDSTAPVQVAVGLATSFDNRHLTVTGNLGGLFTFDLASGASYGNDCGCSPTGLFGLGGSLFRLTGLKDNAVQVFDAATNELWFVPLASPVTEAAAQ